MRIGLLLSALTALALAGCARPRSIEAIDPGACQTAADSLGALDVAIAIDRSSSTQQPSGTDADRDGLVGTFHKSRHTDPDDSWLALQVAAARTLLRETADAEIRYSIVTFSGSNRAPQQRRPRRITLPGDADVESGLTDDIEQLDAALGHVLDRGSAGNTDFATGMREAVQSLSADPISSDPKDSSRKLVLFISDGTYPILVDQDRKMAIVDPIMQDVARKAIDEQIAFNTFGLGNASTAQTPHTLTHMAGATGGRFTAVQNPAKLHCYLLSSLSK